MPVDLSIKNAPDEIVVRLRERAKLHHRSLQGELLAIVEAAALEPRKLTPMEALAKIRRIGVATPAETVEMIRADRDAR